MSARKAKATSVLPPRQARVFPGTDVPIEFPAPRFEVDVSSHPPHLQRMNDSRLIEKSLLAPALKMPAMNDLEERVAGYLDSRQALQWWHRNVAKKQYGLQGWKRNKVYPDFVFGQYLDGERSRIVLLETKGEHLAGATDTEYKRALLDRLTQLLRRGA